MVFEFQILGIFCCAVMSETLKKVGSYRLMRLIGKGATSQVFEGRKEGQPDKFAVKMISIKAMSTKQKEMIAKEVSIIKSMDHPNIVKLYDTLETHNNYYLIFEYCEKGDLEQYLRDYYGPLIPTSTLQKIIYCIGDAISFLHAKGIAHRDIKLANILLKKDCTIILADFGFAKESTENMMMSSYCGTPITMAPEILNGHPYDKKCDIWSLGVILFQLTFGKLPFSITEGYSAFKEKVSNEALFIPDEPMHPKQLVLLLRKTLEKDPERRYSIEEFMRNPWVQSGCTHNEQSKISEVLKGVEDDSHLKNQQSECTTMAIEEYSEHEFQIALRISECLRDEINKINERHLQIRSTLDKLVKDHRQLHQLLIHYDQLYLRNLLKTAVKIGEEGETTLESIKGIFVPEQISCEQMPLNFKAGRTLVNYLKSLSLEEMPPEKIKKRYEIVMKFLEIMWDFDLHVMIMPTDGEAAREERIIRALKNISGGAQKQAYQSVTLSIHCREKSGKMREARQSLRTSCLGRINDIMKVVRY